MKIINGKTFSENTKHDFNELMEIVSILRSPSGCAWDNSQTHESMKECLINEANEVLSAIDNKDTDNLCEELGDLLLQVLLHSEIAKEEEKFTFNDVVQTLAEKLIRRHPHVFGDVKRTETPEESLELWKMVKEKERQLKARKDKNN